MFVPLSSHSAQIAREFAEHTDQELVNMVNKNRTAQGQTELRAYGLENSNLVRNALPGNPANYTLDDIRASRASHFTMPSALAGLPSRPSATLRQRGTQQPGNLDAAFTVSRLASQFPSLSSSILGPARSIPSQSASSHSGVLRSSGTGHASRSAPYSIGSPFNNRSNIATVFMQQSGTAAANPLRLSSTEQTRIKGTHGGQQTLHYIADNHVELTAALQRADIVKIAGNGGGAQALQAVITHRAALTQAGFSAADIVKIAGNNGGAQALQAVIKHRAALTQASFSAADIVEITGNNGGAQALQAIITHRAALTQASFSAADIVKIAGNNGGAQALQAVITQWPALRARTKKEIMIVATKRRGAAGALRQMADAA